MQDRRSFVKNVVAIGNASGFVEPLEATALGVICIQSRLVSDMLVDTDRTLHTTQIAQFNSHHQRYWDGIRGCIAMHYKYNTRKITDGERTNTAVPKIEGKRLMLRKPKGE